MTDFQKKCIDDCQKFVKDALHGELGFHEEMGKKENYFVGKVVHGAQCVEIFVYVDEAGFMVDNKDWSICERPDYDSDEELIKKLIEKLKKYFNMNDPARRPNA